MSDIARLQGSDRAKSPWSDIARCHGSDIARFQGSHIARYPRSDRTRFQGQISGCSVCLKAIKKIETVSTV